MPARYALAFVSCLGFINVYILRVNLSVAVVQMDARTATVTNTSARVRARVHKKYCEMGGEKESIIPCTYLFSGENIYLCAENCVVAKAGQTKMQIMPFRQWVHSIFSMCRQFCLIQLPGSYIFFLNCSTCVILCSSSC